MKSKIFGKKGMAIMINRRQGLYALLFLGVLLASPLFPVGAVAEEDSYPGTKGDFGGFACYSFSFEGRDAKIVVPHSVAEGKPWVWRARFFGHEPQADLALLGLGYHLVWVDSAPLLGSPKSVALWQRFYLYVTENFGLCSKTHLEGMSRGGLYTVNWAVEYPDEVASIYIDNPVLDFKSWPGGFGTAKRWENDWNDILTSYELTEEEAKSYDRIPVSHPLLQNLADRKVPILIVCGDSDTDVPFEENEKPFTERYECLGGTVEMIIKPGNAHHPHSLVDPKPIVDFVVEAQKRVDESK